MSFDLIFKFSVVSKTEPGDIGKEIIEGILVDNETIDLSYRHSRDRVWFTNKRIICMDVQGITGTKKDFKTFPYSKISCFSVETASLMMDSDGDFKIWVSGFGIFQIKFGKKIDILEVGAFLSKKVIE